MPGKYPRNGVLENLRTHIGRKFSATEKEMGIGWAFAELE